MYIRSCNESDMISIHQTSVKYPRALTTCKLTGNVYSKRFQCRKGLAYSVSVNNMKGIKLAHKKDDVHFLLGTHWATVFYISMHYICRQVTIKNSIKRVALWLNIKGCLWFIHVCKSKSSAKRYFKIGAVPLYLFSQFLELWLFWPATQHQIFLL